MAPVRRFAALVLAGSRYKSDPVAQSEAVAHKCLASVGNRPIFDLIIEALEQSEYVDRIFVSLDTTSALANTDTIRRHKESGQVETIGAHSSPSGSVLTALDQIGQPYPLLVVTSDSGMLDTEILNYFCAEALENPIDLQIGLAREEDLKAAYPNSKRTYLRFADGGFSGCNLFALSSSRARKAVAFWRKAEKYRKTPWRLAGTLGPGDFLSIMLRRWSLQTTLSTLGDRLEVSVRPVILPFPRAAIDVDSVEDLALVRQFRAPARAGA